MEKQIVVPGEEIKGKILDNVYEEEGKKYSKIFGLLYKKGDFYRIVPLKGRYIPHSGDYVIGIVTDVKFGGYVLDINSPYSAFLSSRREYDFGDVIFAKVGGVSEIKNTSLEQDRKLFKGDVVEISPVKIPRVIGKDNSMLNLLKDKTGCEIYIGRNGRVWLKGKNPAKAEKAVLKIEKEAHTNGLTERITKFLEKGD